MTSSVTWPHGNLPYLISYRCFIDADANSKSRTLTVLKLLAFNALQFMGSCDPNHAPFSLIYSALVSGISIGVRLPNLKFVSLAITDLLAFDAQKFMGSRDPINCRALNANSFKTVKALDFEFESSYL